MPRLVTSENGIEPRLDLPEVILHWESTYAGLPLPNASPHRAAEAWHQAAKPTTLQSMVTVGSDTHHVRGILLREVLVSRVEMLGTACRVLASRQYRVFPRQVAYPLCLTPAGGPR